MRVFRVARVVAALDLGLDADVVAARALKGGPVGPTARAIHLAVYVARTVAGLSLSQAGEAAGISKQAVSDICRSIEDEIGCDPAVAAQVWRLQRIAREAL